MKRRILPSAALLMGMLLASLILALSGCARRDAAAAEGGAHAAEQRLPVRVLTVERRHFTEYGSYFGEARAVAEARVIAHMGGTVESVAVRAGDPVSRGQSMARIEAERAITNHETAVLAERMAREAYEREQKFVEQGVSTQQRVDQARLEWLNRRSQLLDAGTAREGALAIAPLDGIVTARHVQPLDEIAPGTVAFRVADLSRLRVTVGVPESDIAGVRELRSAEVRFSSFPDRTWSGTPLSFARARSDRGLTFEADIEIENRDGALLSGQTAQVRLALREWPDAVVIPTSTVMIRGNEFSVFVVEDGVARRRTVRLGPSDEEVSVVIAGLREGDRVVSEGMNRLTDGVAVSVVE
ncbi:MAG: efflux RND transporter periplasmic adaptor subunit [Spirochaetaceae bacterium]|nr:MAG: efflux RND transporter periplasmic adaptor subunit [Spirochaetaceae bacterium]